MAAETSRTRRRQHGGIRFSSAAYSSSQQPSQNQGAVSEQEATEILKVMEDRGLESTSGLFGKGWFRDKEITALEALNRLKKGEAVLVKDYRRTDYYFNEDRYMCYLGTYQGSERKTIHKTMLDNFEDLKAYYSTQFHGYIADPLIVGGHAELGQATPFPSRKFELWNWKPDHAPGCPQLGGTGCRPSPLLNLPGMLGIVLVRASCQEVKKRGRKARCATMTRRTLFTQGGELFL